MLFKKSCGFIYRMVSFYFFTLPPFPPIVDVSYVVMFLLRVRIRPGAQTS